MKKILIIDDEQQILNMLEQTLTRRGYDVTTAENGKEGIKIFNNDSIDLVITDMIMPKKEGIETIKEIKLIKPETKIIAISGGRRIAPEQYLKAAEMFGADSVFTKPVDGQELIKCIKNLIPE